MRVLLGMRMAAVAAACLSAPAAARWSVAESPHFVIYADERPEQLAAFATKLERFDKAARHVREMGDPPVGRGNRLTVFVLPNVAAVSKLAGDKFVQGFYAGHASGPVAFVPQTAGEDDPLGMSADVIFFHEYSHHLMFQAITRPYPQWVVEGFAEFMSTVRFEKSGEIGIGLPANHRAWGLFDGVPLRLEVILGDDFTKLTDAQRETLYGRSWLLVHYLTFEKTRVGQLDRYIEVLNTGVDPLTAARTAFGDLKQLDHELNVHLQRNKMSYVKLGGVKFEVPGITVRPLSEGAARAIPLRIQSRSGVTERTSEPLAVKVRALEAQFPNDELVELTLTEAEIDAGHPEASEAAADRILRLNPRNSKAYIFKGRAIIERSGKLTGPARHVAFENARKMFISANKIDTEDPEALMLYYRAYVQEGAAVTPNAIAALHYASDLAPQDGGLRIDSAVAYLNDGKLPEAKLALTPVAYDPHGGEMAKMARAIIGKINAGDAKSALAGLLGKTKPGTASH